MARARNIKPGFFTNEKVVELSMEARLLYIGLWTISDRAGRLEERPRRIKMEIFPADDVNVTACLDAIEREGLIRRYQADGMNLIWIPGFSEHQNPHKNEKWSDLPPHPAEEIESDPVQSQVESGSAPEEHGASTVQAPEEHGGNRADSLNLIPDTGYLIPDCGESRENAQSPPGRAMPIGEHDQSAFDRRFGKPAPFTLVAALCDELGVYTDDLSKRDRGKQESIAKELIADGMTPDDVRRMVRWLQGQAWVTGGIDLGLIKRQRGQWVLAGKPDSVPKPPSPIPKTPGMITNLDELEAYFGGDDDQTNAEIDHGDSVANMAPDWDYPRDDPGIHDGVPGRGSGPPGSGGGGVGARGEVVPQTG